MFTYRKIFKIDCEVERARLGMRSTVGYHVLKRGESIYLSISIYLYLFIMNVAQRLSLLLKEEDIFMVY